MGGYAPITSETAVVIPAGRQIRRVAPPMPAAAPQLGSPLRRANQFDLVVGSTGSWQDSHNAHSRRSRFSSIRLQ
jgi:hypothetical protein